MSIFTHKIGHGRPAARGGGVGWGVVWGESKIKKSPSLTSTPTRTTFPAKPNSTSFPPTLIAQTNPLTFKIITFTKNGTWVRLLPRQFLTIQARTSRPDSFPRLSTPLISWNQTTRENAEQRQHTREEKDGFAIGMIVGTFLLTWSLPLTKRPANCPRQSWNPHSDQAARLKRSSELHKAFNLTGPRKILSQELGWWSKSPRTEKLKVGKEREGSFRLLVKEEEAP